MSETSVADQIDYLLSPRAVRDRCMLIFDLANSGRTHFKVHLNKLPEVVDLVIRVCRENYPSLKIPFHSRWRHFSAGGIDRMSEIQNDLQALDPLERARTEWDLAVVSVLLDAGAGGTWTYNDSETGTTLGRSEGLAIASLRMFQKGIFSSESDSPRRVDASCLLGLTSNVLADGFQVTPQNVLVGLDGRLTLLRNLGQALTRNPLFSGTQLRPGNLIDVMGLTCDSEVSGPELLRAVLDAFGQIWPGRVSFQGRQLGDSWSYPPFGNDEFERIAVFHKLSQWLTYSLIEPLMTAGLRVRGIDQLTGLAEYRNGGLILDSGLIELRDRDLAFQRHTVGSELVVEWRALTVVLLDMIALQVRKELKVTSEEFPLAKVLEGGTWWAGRKLATQKRPKSGVPPLIIESDGTVF